MPENFPALFVWNFSMMLLLVSLTNTSSPDIGVPSDIRKVPENVTLAFELDDVTSKESGIELSVN